MDHAKSQFRGRLEHIVSFRSWRLTNTGPKTARTYKYTCFQTLASVLCDALTTYPAIDPQSQHRFNAISPNQTALQTSRPRGKLVPASVPAKRLTPRHFNNLPTSRALLCSASQQTPLTELPPQRPTQTSTNQNPARPNQEPERKLTPC